MKRFVTLLVWVLLAVAFFGLIAIDGRSKPNEFRSFAAFLEDVGDGQVAEVRAHDNQISVTLHTGGRYFTLGVVDDRLMADLSAQGVPVRQGEEPSALRSVMPWLIPALVVIAVIVYFLRKAKGGTGDIFSMRKSQARLLPDAAKVTFADVGGCEEAKLLLGDLVDFLRYPQRWAQAGVRLPRGILLEGPPGCGKTLLARAVAGETNARFYLSSASEFVEMFVGVGAARVRDTFEIAKKNAPAVIFIDELDAVGRRRGSGVGSSHDEREQTLNQLLLCLDGLECRAAVVVIAATNRPDILDPALLRPGRIDRRIKIPPLSRDARLQILEIHTRNKLLAPDVSLPSLADRTEGFSGAQLESLANEAGLLAVRRVCHGGGQRAEVRLADFLDALKPTSQRSRFLDKLDAVLVESTTQLAEPTGRAVVRVQLDDECSVQGDLIWVDANFLKIRTAKSDVIVPKAHIRQIEALEGTEEAVLADVVPDPWYRKSPGTA